MTKYCLFLLLLHLLNIIIVVFVDIITITIIIIVTMLNTNMFIIITITITIITILIRSVATLVLGWHGGGTFRRQVDIHHPKAFQYAPGFSHGSTWCPAAGFASTPPARSIGETSTLRH